MTGTAAASVFSSLSGALHLEVADPSQVGSARRAAAALAQRLGLPAEDAGAAALAVTELATNLVRHAGGGEIALWWSADESAERSGEGAAERPRIELLAIDAGPGMADVPRSFRDGYSTSGTAGSGLGSVRRAARDCDVWSRPGQGSVVWVRLGRRRSAPARRRRFEVGALTTPKPGQECFGDAWAVASRDGVLTALVVDGVGHGPRAADASQLAVSRFCEGNDEAPEATVSALDEELRGSRGAVAGVAHVDSGAGRLRWCGVGNIAGMLFLPGEDKPRRFVSHNGTLGHAADRVQAFDHACPPGSLLVVHSDGLTTSWSLGDYPGLAGHHPAVIAGVLHRDHRRGRDDATILVVRVGADAAQGGAGDGG